MHPMQSSILHGLNKMEGFLLRLPSISNESGSNESGESKREEKKMGVGIKEVVKKII